MPISMAVKTSSTVLQSGSPVEQPVLAMAIQGPTSGTLSSSEFRSFGQAYDAPTARPYETPVTARPVASSFHRVPGAGNSESAGGLGDGRGAAAGSVESEMVPGAGVSARRGDVA